MKHGSQNGSTRAGGPAGVSRDLGAVIRRLPRFGDSTAARTCSRPDCAAAATATLTFSYATKEVWLAVLAQDPDPDSYDLCDRHAARTRAPSGWRLTDRRVDEDEPGPARPPGFQTIQRARLEVVEEPPEEPPGGPGPADTW